MTFSLIGQDGIDLALELDEYRKQRGFSYKRLSLEALRDYVDDVTLSYHIDSHLKNLSKPGPKKPKTIEGSK